ncbi:MAG: DMT family transporter [Proteobacteria bacterium]|nr:DMT family transporter [Pseudomonadota bacterium]
MPLTDSSDVSGEPTGSAPRVSLLVPWLLLVGGASIYGGIFAANKLVAEAGVPFIAYTFWQTLIAGVVLFTLSLITRNVPPTSFRHLRHYTIISALGVVLPVLVLTFVASKLPAGVVTLLITLTPAMTYVFALMFRLERFHWISMGGVGVGLAGVLLIALPDGSLPQPEDVVWVLLLLVVPFMFATNNIIVTIMHPPRTTSLMLATGLVLTAAAITFPIMLISEGFYGFWQATRSGTWAVLWASSINVVTFLCFFEIIRRTSPVFFAQYNYVIVISGVLWSIALFDENLSAWIWAALAVMIAGMLLANEGARRSLRKDGAAQESGQA